jgi:PST family polysaccharide transporter
MSASSTVMSATKGPVAAPLRKSASWGAARAVVQLVCSFVSIKFTAVYLGPAGLALVAQFNNFISLCLGLVRNGLETAATRLAAEHGADEDGRRRLLGTAAKVGLGLGLATAFVVAVASPWLASWLLVDRGYAWVFVLGALSAVAAIFNGLLLSALSSRGEVGRVVLSHILTTILGLVMFAPACVYWGVTGGLLASALVFMASLAVTLVLVRRSTTVNLRDFVGRFDRGEARRIAGFYPMLVVNAVTTPLSLILIRQHVTTSLSLDAAGIWQAALRISDVYLLVVTSIVTTQFMARLGATIKQPERFRAEVLRTLSLAVGATAAFAIGIFLLREWVVRLIFSAAFVPVVDILAWQMVGDVFKMAGITMGFVLVALVRSRWYISILLAAPTTFVLVSQLLVAHMGVQGVTTAHAIAGVAHCALGMVALRDVLFRGRSTP